MLTRWCGCKSFIKSNKRNEIRKQESGGAKINYYRIGSKYIEHNIRQHDTTQHNKTQQNAAKQNATQRNRKLKKYQWKYGN